MAVTKIDSAVFFLNILLSKHPHDIFSSFLFSFSFSFSFFKTAGEIHRNANGNLRYETKKKLGKTR